jgi:hypothetical protein
MQPPKYNTDEQELIVFAYNGAVYQLKYSSGDEFALPMFMTAWLSVRTGNYYPGLVYEVLGIHGGSTNYTTIENGFVKDTTFYGWWTDPFEGTGEEGIEDEEVYNACNDGNSKELEMFELNEANIKSVIS